MSTLCLRLITHSDCLSTEMIVIFNKCGFDVFIWSSYIFLIMHALWGTFVFFLLSDSDVVNFDGRSGLLYRLSLQLRQASKESFSLKFKTLRNSGILLHAEGKGEHSLTLELEKGKLLLLLQTGTTLKVILGLHRVLKPLISCVLWFSLLFYLQISSPPFVCWCLCAVFVIERDALLILHMKCTLLVMSILCRFMLSSALQGVRMPSLIEQGSRCYKVKAWGSTHTRY